jgi:hypothetical protein
MSSIDNCTKILEKFLKLPKPSPFDVARHVCPLILTDQEGIVRVWGFLDGDSFYTPVYQNRGWCVMDLLSPKTTQELTSLDNTLTFVSIVVHETTMFPIFLASGQMPRGMFGLNLTYGKHGKFFTRGGLRINIHPDIQPVFGARSA